MKNIRVMKGQHQGQLCYDSLNQLYHIVIRDSQSKVVHQTYPTQTSGVAWVMATAWVSGQENEK